MATTTTRAPSQKDSSTNMKKNLDSWKFPKIPVDQIYKKKALRIFPSYAIKDFQKTITLKSSKEDVIMQLLSGKYLKGFLNKKHNFLHLGLVQISIKSLMRDGLGAPIIVCLRDGRHLDFKDSLLAIVESNMSEGPFYFNCFPSFAVSAKEVASLEALTLNVKTNGVPLALTYRIVCKAMVDLSSEAIRVPTLGETTYVQAYSENPNTAKWDDVEVPPSWTRPDEDEEKKDGFRPVMTFQNGRVVWGYN